MNRITRLTMCGLVQALIAFTSLPASAMTGEELYQSRCLACHGAKGDGQGPLANTMTIKPKALAGLARDAFENAIFMPMKGADGHGIAALLTPAERNDLIDYLVKFGQ